MGPGESPSRTLDRARAGARRRAGPLRLPAAIVAGVLAALAWGWVPAQEGDPDEIRLVLEVRSVRDSLSFTETWWGDRDPHYWISTGGDPHDLLRFEGVDVPPGATVTSARLIVWSFNAASDDPDDHVTLWAEQVDDASQVESPADAWSRKDRRGAVVRWPTTNAGRGIRQPSPDLAALIQEIVDRPGWEAGNAIQFFAAANDAPANDGRQMHSYYTGDAGATRPRLELSYVIGRAGEDAPGGGDAEEGQDEDQDEDQDDEAR